MPPIDLSLVPTKDLLDEICTRVDYLIMHAIIERNGPTGTVEDGTEVFAIRRVGDPLKCIGMTVQIQRRILKELESRTEETDGSNL